MKLLIFILLLSFLDARAQASKESNSSGSKDPLSCIYKQKYSPAQRNQFYPFNIADTVKLVSYRYHRNDYPVKGDALIIDSLIEIKTLLKDQINELTDILYNNFYKRKANYGELSKCFLPRHAILFFDKTGHLKEHILLCFHCDTHRNSSNKIRFGDDCEGKMEKLRQFFMSGGLKFGTDTRTIVYPGESPD